MGNFSDALAQHTRLQDRITNSKDLLKSVREHLALRPACSRSDL